MRGRRLAVLFLIIMVLAVGCLQGDAETQVPEPVITKSPQTIAVVETPLPTEPSRPDMMVEESKPISERSGWSVPINITNTPIGSTEPVAAADRDSVLHLVWNEYRPKGDDWGTQIDSLFYTALEGGEWSQPTRIIGESEDFSTDWSMTIDKEGNLHLIWPVEKTYRVPGYLTYGIEAGGIFYMNKSKKGNWSELVEVFNSEDYGEFGDFWQVEVVVDGQGTPHVVFDYVYDVAPSKILYITRREDGSWSEPIEIPSHPIQGHSLNLAVDREDTLHLAWREFELGRWMHATKPKGGSWSNPVELIKIRNPFLSTTPEFQMLLDSRDNLHFVWEYRHAAGGSEIFYATRPKGGDFSNFINVSKTPGEWELSLDYDFIIDSNNTLHLVWQESIPLGEETIPPVQEGFDDVPVGPLTLSELRYATKPEDGSWSEPETIATSKSELGGYELMGMPSIAELKKDIHILWVATLWKSLATPPDSYKIGDEEIFHSYKLK